MQLDCFTLIAFTPAVKQYLKRYTKSKFIINFAK